MRQLINGGVIAERERHVGNGFQSGQRWPDETGSFALIGFISLAFMKNPRKG